MSSLADDIKALMDLGHSLESATELAVADRNRTPTTQPGNYLILCYLHRIFYISVFYLLLMNEI